MTPRVSMGITAAALRWNTARARRLTLGAETRVAEQACNELSIAELVRTRARTQADRMSRELSEAKRLERAALRALAKLCATARDGLADAEVIEAEPLSPTRPAIGQD